MELWWRVAGYCRVRLTGADLSRTLGELTEQGVRLEDLRFSSELTVECTISRSQWSRLRSFLQGRGVKTEFVGTFGGVRFWLMCRRNPMVTAVAVLLLAATMWVPSRLLFFRVEGNQTVPTRMILEYAAQCGVSFGASRRALRSEQVKNKLLEAMPELRWVGVNTRGCVATIQVRERQVEEAAVQPAPGDLVAIRDAVVESVCVTAGQTRCAVGQAVQAGQVLVSGIQDLGLCTRVEAAQGEIFGRTQRTAQAVLPLEQLQITKSCRVQRKFSLIFGKNRINLHSDSGIPLGSCGKMTRETQWVLPGGWALPVWLVEEVYTAYDTQPAQRTDWLAELRLREAARRQTLEDMVAGTLLSEQSDLRSEEGCYRLRVEYDCRELIGIQRSAITQEGDTTDDRTNDERRTG